MRERRGELPMRTFLCSLLAACHCAAAQQSIGFEDATLASGIRYSGPSYGAAWGDFDGDGAPDLWVSGHSAIHLYRNRDGVFEDISRQVVDDQPADRHGAAWADFDNDGDDDLIQLVGAELGTGSGENHLFVQRGGRLIDMARSLGVADGLGRGRSPLWLDYDGDGRLDVLVNNAARDDAPTRLFRGTTGAFEEVTVAARLGVHSSDYGVLAHLDGTGIAHVLLGEPFPQRVLTLDGRGLNDVTARLGITARPASDAVVADLDNDLLPEIISVAGSLTSEIYRPAADQFAARLVTAGAPREARFASRGTVTFLVYPFSAAWWPPESVFLGDRGVHPERIPFVLAADEPRAAGLSPRAETDKGIYIGYDRGLERWRLVLHPGDGAATVTLLATSTAMVGDLERVGFEPFAPTDTGRLLHNLGGSFVDRTERLRLPGRINAHAIGAGDYDNDMDIDLYLVCSGAMRNAPNILLENRGDGTFRMVPDAGGASADSAGLGETVAVADYDGDGSLDLFVTNGLGLAFGNGPYLLFHNRGNDNHWLEIDLEGVASNRDGIGARVVVTAGGVSQLRTQGNGTHGKAQDHRRLHFGLGSNATVETIEIRWPSGRTQKLSAVAVDRILRIVEPG